MAPPDGPFPAPPSPLPLPPPLAVKLGSLLAGRQVANCQLLTLATSLSTIDNRNVKECKKTSIMLRDEKLSHLTVVGWGGE